MMPFFSSLIVVGIAVNTFGDTSAAAAAKTSFVRTYSDGTKLSVHLIGTEENVSAYTTSAYIRPSIVCSQPRTRVFVRLYTPTPSLCCSRALLTCFTFA